jgi:hypothetical protein
MKDSTSRGTAALGRLPEVTSIAAARQQAKVDVRGVIREVDVVSLAGTPAFRCLLADDTGQIDLLFLGRAAVAGLEPGRRCRAVGTVAARDGRAVLWNPRYWLEPPAPAVAYLPRPFAADPPLARIRSR